MIGFVLSNKPVSFSSFRWLKKVAREFISPVTGLPVKEKWGHSGTLDPFAQGLLLCAVGNATRLIPLMNWESKTYEAILQLGSATDTQDREGQVVQTALVPPLSTEKINQVLTTFLGTQTQIPPIFSAKKIEGKRAYQYAREGHFNIEMKPQEITIDSIELVSWESALSSINGLSTVRFRVRCSHGTYVRTIAHDLALRLGTVGHLVYLKRCAIGSFEAPDMDCYKWMSVPEWLNSLSPKKTGDMSTLHFETNPFEATLLANGTIPHVYQEKISEYCKSEAWLNGLNQKFPLLLEFWNQGVLEQLGWYWHGQQKIIAQLKEV